MKGGIDIQTIVIKFWAFDVLHASIPYFNIGIDEKKNYTFATVVPTIQLDSNGKHQYKVNLEYLTNYI